jgi:FdhD protein
VAKRNFGDSLLNSRAEAETAIGAGELSKLSPKFLFASGHDVSPLVSGRIHSKDGIRPEVWKLPEEAPASILYNGQSFAVMMVTPADLEDFATGFTITEGIAGSATEIRNVRIAEAGDGFLINIDVSETALQGAEGRRRTLTGRSGCGICGAQSLDAVMKPLAKVSGMRPEAEAILKAFEQLPKLQPMNLENRSTHAAAFCDLSGNVELVREDIGRHNALDKLAGALARQGRDASNGFVLMSSRCSIELVQKAAAIRAPFLASISAPTALALRLAQRAGMSIAAKSRDGLMMFDDFGDKPDDKR